MMKLKELTTNQQAYWKSIYLNAFPAYERVAFEQLLNLAKVDQSVKLLLITEDEQNIGILLIVEVTSDKAYILYFAIDAAIRGGGYGSKTVALLKECYPNGIILESEQTGMNADNEEQRVKRYRFYEKNGVVDSGYLAYNQDAMFHLMRTTDTITPNEYVQAIRKFGIEPKISKQ